VLLKQGDHLKPGLSHLAVSGPADW